MIDADLLMLYMSHLGEGSWATLRPRFQAAAGLDERGEGVSALRYALEEIGFADFFVERNTPRGQLADNGWKVCPTSLMALASGREALLCGARDQPLLQALEQTANSEGCSFEIRTVTVKVTPGLSSLSFTLPRVAGTPPALFSLARHLDIPFIADAPDAWLEAFPSLASTLRLACPEELGSSHLGWEMRLLKPGARAWATVSQLPQNPEAGSVFEWVRPWLARRRAVYIPTRGWVGVGDREAVYAGASVSQHQLLRYDREGKSLFVPAAFPLPRPCARAAALCAGDLPTYRNGERIYSEVPPRVAAVIGLRMGQPDLDVPKGNGETP